MRILIILPSQDRVTGNWITASRFQLGLEKQGHHVIIHDTPLRPRGELRKRINAFAPDVALLLHAYRSGRPWVTEKTGMNIPYVVLLTGTDINHGLDDPEEGHLIRTVLRQSSAVLVQNALIADEIQGRHPELLINLKVLAPGIILGNAPYDLRKIHALARDMTLFLCPAGLRPVKGVLPLLEMFDQIALQSAGFQVAFCGPQLDIEYSRHFLAAVDKRPWARYLGTVPPQAMASAMREANILLNNSQSEGLANALLEAATIGLPILARKIPGNATVVRHNCNGFLYENEREFKRYALQMLDREKRRQLVCPNATLYDPDQETAELSAILLGAAKTMARC